MTVIKGTTNDMIEIFDQIKTKKKPITPTPRTNNIVVKTVIEPKEHKNKKKCCQ